MARASRKATSVLGIVLFTAALSAPSASAASSIPPPPGASVTLVGDNPRYDCEGTSLAASEPLTGFTVSHSKFHVSAGADSAPLDGRKACQVPVRIHVPEGYTFAIEQAEDRVFADLTRGASGSVAMGYCPQGASCSPPPSYEIRGPFSDIWTHSDKTPSDQLVFMRCGQQRVMFFYSELRVSEGSDSSLLNRMAWDTPGTRSTYGLAWKTCP